MATLTLYLDEDSIAGSFVRAIRSAGIEVVSTREAAREGTTDPEQLRFATQQGRVIYTCNVGDFNALHKDWMAAGREHAGIVLNPHQRMDPGEQARRLARLAEARSAEQMRNHLEWLSAWA